MPRCYGEAMSSDFMMDEAKDLALKMLRDKVAKLEAENTRLLELYKSACEISEQRRQELVKLREVAK
jgi:hypothetical protein